MMASAEPETMKSTVAMLGLKAVGDMKQFCELNTSVAAVDQMRDSSSLPTVSDDIEREKAQHRALVGSLQAGTKSTVTHGETEKLGGLIFTKNIDPERQKIDSKVVEGRLIWLHMRPDPEYEN